MKRLILTLLAVWILNTTILSSSLKARTPARQALTQASKVRVNPDALRELLIKGLKAIRDDQIEYIDLVVARVVNGTLPISIVYASFKYARTRRLSYPFPYFVLSVETLAKRNKR